MRLPAPRWRMGTAAATLTVAAALVACGADPNAESTGTSPSDAAVRVATADQVEAAVNALVAQSNDQVAAQDLGGAAITLKWGPGSGSRQWPRELQPGVCLAVDGSEFQRDAALFARFSRIPGMLVPVNIAILTELSDVRAAISLYRRAVRLDPTSAAAYVRLGHALDKVGAAKEAARSLREGYRLDPALPGAN